jgi:hypothetical protein
MVKKKRESCIETLFSQGRVAVQKGTGDDISGFTCEQRGDETGSDCVMRRLGGEPIRRQKRRSADKGQVVFSDKRRLNMMEQSEMHSAAVEYPYTRLL